MDEESGLARMIAHLGFSQAVIELISYLALVVVVVFAGLIVVNELRSAGVLGARRGRPAGHSAAHSVNPRGGLSWPDVERAPFLHKPRLAQQNRLPPVRGLTVRELTRAARLPDEGDRGRLAELALAAERVRFSDREVSPDHIEAALERGRELLDRLETQASNLQTASGRS
jgi:hypothetical protein